MARWNKQAVAMDLTQLEDRRLELQNNVDRLRKALKHWQTWDADYEGLTEELNTAGRSHESEDLAAVAKNFEGELVNESEIRDLFGIDKPGHRRPVEQILRLISHRIDYVGKNATSLERQLANAEDELQELKNRQEARPRDVRLPLTEIIEELDEDDNVISGRTTYPGDATPDMLEMLKKAGVEERDLPGSASTRLPNQEDKDRNIPSPSKQSQGEVASPTDASNENSNVPDDSAAYANETVQESARKSERHRPRKKSVSFAEGTKQESRNNLPSPSMHSYESVAERDTLGQPPVGISKLAQETFPPNVRAIELDDEERPIGVNAPSRPIDESPEDAAMRREMEQYSLNEVGSIVAQLDMEEGSSSDSYAESDETDDDDEDDFGLYHGIHMEDAYREKMLELEQKLNANMIQNIGPDPSELADVPTKAPNNDSPRVTLPLSEDKQKTVRFAPDVDVAPVPGARTLDKSNPHEANTASSPSFMKDTIVERKTPQTQDHAPSAPAKKASRFKTSRQSGRSTSQAPSSLLSDVQERALPETAQTPSEPDDMDPEVLDRQVRSEYYRKRNDLIQRQGGFLPKPHEQEGVLDDDNVPRDASGKRVSRFKAARMDPSRVW
ncbi:MAG: hypothetical protein M1828_006719 [Chrysothrix sp. TS-e1954]|nr:MAG: hypothetical protein M1828_006719 [Chrysothrix sp. TS-e1954]